MATRADALTTLASIDAIMGGTNTAVREAAIDAATGAVLAWLGRQVVNNPSFATVTTELLDGDDFDLFYTREYPINAVTSLYDDPSRAYGASTLLTLGTHYLIYAEEGRIQLVSTPGVSVVTSRETAKFNKGQQNIKIVYTAGYNGLAAVPDEIVQACTEWALLMLNTQKGTGLSETSLSLCRSVFRSYAQSNGIPPHIATLLAPYRTPMIARV